MPPPHSKACFSPLDRTKNTPPWAMASKKRMSERAPHPINTFNSGDINYQGDKTQLTTPGPPTTQKYTCSHVQSLCGRIAINNNKSPMSPIFNRMMHHHSIYHFIHIHLHTQFHTYIYVYTHTYRLACVCTCIHLHTPTRARNARRDSVIF